MGPAAAEDLQAIERYLRQHHPALAHPTIGKLYGAARSLRQSPFRGRIGRKAASRELVLAPLPYIIVYGVEPEIVHIFRIIHAAQDWR